MLFFIAISSIFEFIYYQSLLDKKVRIRKNFSKHMNNGLRFMAVRIISLILTGVFIIGGIAGFFVNPLIGIVGILGIILLLIPLSVVMGLINNFVVPETIIEKQSFWHSIKTGLGKAREELEQTAVYILVRFGVKIAAGIAMMIYFVVVLLASLIVFGIPAAILYFIHPLLVAIPAIVGILAFIAAMLAGNVVTQTYLKFYALRVFGNFGEE